MSGADSLEILLKGLPDAAREWLLDVWSICQLLDDAADGDPIGRERAEAAAWVIFVKMPLNPFWVERSAILLPILSVQVLKWRAANEAEAEGAADARSFMWRAGFYDLLLAVAHLCGVLESPRAVLSLYGETLPAYLAEFEGVAHA